MNKLFFIVEGEHVEPQVIKNMNKCILKEINSEIVLSFGNNIYELYEKIKEKPYLNIIEILNKIKNKNYNPDEYTDIYLFFDYDGHDTKAADKKIKEMLKLFSNPTENGKLYINYPMVESLKQLSLEDITYEISKCSNFKKYIENNIKNDLKNINHYSFDIWKEIIQANVKKVNFLFDKKFEICKRKEIKSQEEIFDCQEEKYINPQREIFILNSFPLFICNFIKESYYNKLISN